MTFWYVPEWDLVSVFYHGERVMAENATKDTKKAETAKTAVPATVAEKPKTDAEALLKRQAELQNKIAESLKRHSGDFMKFITSEEGRALQSELAQVTSRLERKSQKATISSEVTSELEKLKPEVTAALAKVTASIKEMVEKKYKAIAEAGLEVEVTFNIKGLRKQRTLHGGEPKAARLTHKNSDGSRCEKISAYGVPSVKALKETYPAASAMLEEKFGSAEKLLAVYKSIGWRKDVKVADLPDGTYLCLQTQTKY